MRLPDTICPNCLKPIAEGMLDTNRCPLCGYELSPDLASAYRATHEADSPRSPLWRFFWICFIATPTLVIASSVPSPVYWKVMELLNLPMIVRQESISLALLVVGALASGYLLARIYSTTSLRVAAMTLVFSFGLMIVYSGIALPGCIGIASLMKTFR